jgi:hypothetical protein
MRTFARFASYSRTKRMTEKTTIPDPEDLSEEERREILRTAAARTRRRIDNEIIAKELTRRAQEDERERS